MGFLKKLFGLEKKTETSAKLNQLMGQVDNQVFPNGSVQKEEEACDVARELGVPVESIRGAFVYASIKTTLGCDRESLIIGIQKSNPELTEEQVNKLAKYVFKKSLKQKMGVDNEIFLNEYLKGVGFVDVVGSYDEIPDGFGEFGLEVSNPVPVNGIPSNERYLSRLRTASGGSIKWNRVGSCQAPNLLDPVDLYTITDEYGKKLPSIYISPYHPKTSSKAPKGYRID